MSVQENAEALRAAAEALPIGPAEATQGSVATVMELTQSVFHQLGNAPGRVTEALGEGHAAVPELAGLAAKLKGDAEGIAVRVVQLDTDQGELVQRMRMLYERLTVQADRLLQG